MTKSFFVFLVLLLFVGAAVWFLFEKNKEVSLSPSESASPTAATGTNNPMPSTTTRADGLQIQDVKVGTGKEAKAGDGVSVHYVGMLSTGQKFDSSYDRNQPALFTVGVGSLIKGWDEGIPGMRVGGKRHLIIPPALGYGASGIPAKDEQGGVIPGQYVIPPNATLVFDVELLDVLPAQ